jgi:hypothetical protein
MTPKEANIYKTAAWWLTFLWASFLALPMFTFTTQTGHHSLYTGLEFLIAVPLYLMLSISRAGNDWGWATIGWFANICFITGLRRCFRGTAPSPLTALIGLGIASTMLLNINVHLNFATPLVETLYSRHVGFWLWLCCFFIMLVVAIFGPPE